MRYVITVPESQMITAQEHLSPAPLTLEMQFWPDGTDNGTHPLPLAGIWKAVQAVNDDLTLRDLQLRLPGPNHLIC